MSEAAFNFSKAIKLNPSPFKAFDVEDEIFPLADILQKGDLTPDSKMLVAERTNGVIALDRREMSFHQVAQGKLHDEPWMVVF